jgi:flagellar hook-length control protein FliK
MTNVLLLPFNPASASPAEWLVASDTGADGSSDFAEFLTLESFAAHDNHSESAVVVPPSGSVGESETLVFVVPPSGGVNQSQPPHQGATTNALAVRSNGLAEDGLEESLPAESLLRNIEPPLIPTHTGAPPQPLPPADNAPNFSVAHLGKTLTIHRLPSVKLTEPVVAIVSQRPDKAGDDTPAEPARDDFDQPLLVPTVGADLRVCSGSELSAIAGAERQVGLTVDASVEERSVDNAINPLRVSTQSSTESVDDLNLDLAPKLATPLAITTQAGENRRPNTPDHTLEPLSAAPTSLAEFAASDSNAAPRSIEESLSPAAPLADVFIQRPAAPDLPVGVPNQTSRSPQPAPALTAQAAPGESLSIEQHLPEVAPQLSGRSETASSTTQTAQPLADLLPIVRSPQPPSVTLFRTLLAEPERLEPTAFEAAPNSPNNTNQALPPLTAALVEQTANYPSRNLIADLKVMSQPVEPARNVGADRLIHPADWMPTEAGVDTQVYSYASSLRGATTGLRQPTESTPPLSSVGLLTPRASATKHAEALFSEILPAQENDLSAVAAPTEPDSAASLRPNEQPWLPATKRSILSMLQTELPAMTKPTMSPTLQPSFKESVADQLPAAQISEFDARLTGASAEKRVFVQVQTALYETTGQPLQHSALPAVTVPARAPLTSEQPELLVPHVAPVTDGARVTDKLTLQLERLSTNFAEVNAPPAGRRGLIETRAPQEPPGETNSTAPITAQPAAPGIQLAQVTISSTPGHVAKQLAEPLLAASEYIAPGASRSWRLKLRPQELGQVEVEITRDATGRLSAQLKVEHAQTGEILRGELPLLRDALERAGLQVGRLDVTTDASSASFGWHTGGQQQQADYTDYRATGRTPDPEFFVPESTLNGGAQAAQDRLLNLHA